MKLYRTPIFTSYRTCTSHIGGLEHRGLHSVSLRWTYKQPIRGRFMNLMLSWNRRTNEQLYQSSYNALVYTRTPTSHRYNADTYHSSDESLSSNFFADVHISYQWRRYELQLTCNNLLGNHLYENRLHTSVTDVYSAYRLCPREVLLDFSIEF